MIGTKYNNLTVIEQIGKNQFYCKCDCGNIVTRWTSDLKKYKGHTCLKCRKKPEYFQKINGLSSHTLYGIWKTMFTKCYKTQNESYKDYGARGIKVCARWNDIELFIKDMGPRPAGYTLSLIDLTQDFKPDNCKWIPFGEHMMRVKHRNSQELPAMESPIKSPIESVVEVQSTEVTVMPTGDKRLNYLIQMRQSYAAQETKFREKGQMLDDLLKDYHNLQVKLNSLTD